MSRIIDNRYEVISLLGEGSLGQVFHVLDLSEDVPRALKVLTNLEEREHKEELLKDEFRRLRKFSHPLVLKVHDFGYAGKHTPYFTMDFMEGGSLPTVSRPLPEPVIQHVLGSLLVALHYLHTRGCVHGDVKHENVLLNSPSPLALDQLPSVKLADFSLTHTLRHLPLNQRLAHDSPDVFTGTLRYAAPEQFFNRHLTYRADLYSLGVVVYQLATGMFPFTGDKPSTLIDQVLNQQPVPPSRLNGNISGGLEALILKLLQREPLKRFQSAREALLELGVMPHSVGKHFLLEYSDGSVAGHKFECREREIEFAEEAIRAVSQGLGNTLVFYGERGIGKSVLCDEIKVLAQMAGLQVVMLRSEQIQFRLPSMVSSLVKQLVFTKEQLSAGLTPNQFSTFQQLADKRVTVESPPNDEGLFGRTLSVSSEQIESTVGEQIPSADLHLQQIFDIIFRILSLRCDPESSSHTGETQGAEEWSHGTRPLLLIIEDLHHADPDVIAFCSYLARNNTELPIGLVLTFRDEMLLKKDQLQGRHLQRLQEELSNMERVKLFRLSRFTIEETARFVTSFLEITKQPEGFIKQLHDKTAGNPRHITQVLKYLLENNVLSFEQGNWWISDHHAFAQLPSRLDLLGRRRLSQLTELQRSILQIAAFLGNLFSLHHLSVVSGKAIHLLADILDELVELQHVVRSVHDGNVVYYFADQGFRNLVIEEMKPVPRADNYRAVAEFWEGQYTETGVCQGFTLDLLAEYFLKCGERERAFHYYVLAAKNASKHLDGSLRLHCIDQASTLIPQSMPEEERWQLTKEHADALFYANRLPEALEKYQALLNAKQSVLSLEQKAWVQSKIGGCYEKLDRLQDAREFYEQVLSRFGAQNEIPEVMLPILSSLGWVLSSMGELKEATALGRRAVRLARASGNQFIKARTYNQMAHILRVRGELEKALDFFQKALRLHRKMHNERGIAVSYSNIGIVYDKMGDYPRAIEFHQKSLDLISRVGDLYWEADEHSNLAAALAAAGQWEKAQDSFTTALHLYKRQGITSGEATVEYNLGEVMLLKGEFKQSHLHFMRAVTLKERLHDRVGVARIFHSLANLAIRQNEPQAAVDYLSRARSTFLELNLSPDLGINARLQAQVLVLQGKHATALREISKAMKYLDELNLPREKGIAFRVLGEIAMEMGNHEKALQHFTNSVQLLEQAEAVYELGFTWLIMARFRLNTGMIREAGQALENAETLFEKFSSPYLIQQARSIRQELQLKLQPYYVDLPADKEQLRSLIRISQLLNSIKDSERLFEEVLDVIIKTVEADRAALFIRDKLTGELVPEVIRNIEQETLRDATQLSQTAISMVHEQAKPLYITDTRLDSLTSTSKSVTLYGITAILCVPLKIYDKIIGVVYLDSRSMAEVFLERDLQFLTAFANMAALALANSMERSELIKQNTMFRTQNNDFINSAGIVIRSKPMREIFQIVAKVASSASNVIITGESGTGKEVVARAIHSMGSRKNELFFPFFCGNVPDTILDSELFGHVKGAFSGAITNKKGILEEAHNGTVFLDEITEVGPISQAKLLRFLQEREIRPVGATFIKKVNVRIIAATNKNLEVEVKKGRFREDLYYRLKVIQIHIPPLRERRDDIAALAHHFLKKYNELLGKNISGFSKTVMDRFMDYSWPGNVRELENQVELMVNLAPDKGVIDESLLSDEVRNIENIIGQKRISGSLKEILAHVERELISTALLEHGGNKTRAAKKLGITRQCLNQKLKALKLN